ncbi:MAG: ATP synthase subunit I [Armatimonadota bacterium]|nr:ATP synthase subunit I [Armatimonadota bacterium]
MDERVIWKVYRSVMIAWALAMIWCWVFQNALVAANITIGMAVGTAILFTFHHVVRRAFTPGKSKGKKALLKLALIKYPVALLILIALVRWSKFNIAAFCGGIVLVHFALYAKLAGILIAEQNKSKQS